MLLAAREEWALHLVGEVEGHLVLVALFAWLEEVDWERRVLALGLLLRRGEREGMLGEPLLLSWLHFLVLEVVAGPRFAVLCHLAFGE